MEIVGIIPARMGSSRFPGKPLAQIHGIPMIGHCYFRTRMSSRLGDVYVATCDEEIKRYIEEMGGRVIMTSPHHKRATDRTAEAVKKIEETTCRLIDIVVMIQGDEPMIRPEMIDTVVKPLMDDPSIVVANGVAPLKSRGEHLDPNEVKVVVDRDNFALYFSREPIPSFKMGAETVPMKKQVCIIPFRRDFLMKFLDLEPTPLEEAESVDMLRALEHGFGVKMVPMGGDTYAVDTPEDLVRVEKLMAKDDLMKEYI